MASRGDWCILRTAGRSTLPLAASLASAGYDAWTPATLIDRRPAGAFASKRERAKTVELRVPMTPTYVFARARHLFELIMLSANPGQKHEGFSVMRTQDGVPLVSDASLEGLREEEAKRLAWLLRARRKRDKPSAAAYDVGDRIRVSAGSFAGLEGVVEQSTPRHTLLCFGGSLRMKIETFVLRSDSVDGMATPASMAA